MHSRLLVRPDPDGYSKKNKREGDLGKGGYKTHSQADKDETRT